MRGYFRALRREWRWLPTKREVGAFVALLIATILSGLAVSRVAITTPEGFKQPVSWNSLDELFVGGLLFVSLFAIYTAFRFLRAEAAAGRPATSRLFVGASVFWIVLLTVSFAAPLVIAEILAYTATPRYENLTTEEVWKAHAEESLTPELYVTVCQAIVDRDYEMDRPIRQCIDPDNPESLLALEPSDEAREFRIIFRNIYHMKSVGARLLAYWLLGLAVLVASLIVGRGKRQSQLGEPSMKERRVRSHV